MSISKQIKVIILLVCLCYGCGCADRDDHNLAGWDALRAENYPEAEKQFKLYLEGRNTGLQYGYNGLGKAYLAQGKYVEAEPLLLKALTLWERELGRDNLVVAGILSDLGSLYAKQGNINQALPYFKRNLEIQYKVIPNSGLAGEMTALADIYRKQGKYEEAEPLYERAIGVLTESKEADRAPLANALEGYASLLRETDRSSEAVSLEQRAKVIRANSP